MKGPILSDGYGIRVHPIVYSKQKQLIPVVNKPILFYATEEMIDAARWITEGNVKMGALNNA
ncbi:MAG: hypothetical protein LAKADJCE_00048 [Candidatus Argoarchaeum ethanivorans]|uniref:Nucleotidyl transferase domain-containing protein n=1 Tax=Candidatus Argoarchaeum ethanivorans TaxID=2608793 RepID=A0A811T6C4_9EURY|nr:MAG: hypothetical protein LAKADJCE_00048 [Candidatus Argoarchaeum ethanivorans]